MKALAMTIALVSGFGLGASPALAKDSDAKAVEMGAMEQQQMPMARRNHLFEERAGTWKATCDEMEDNKI